MIFICLKWNIRLKNFRDPEAIKEHNSIITFLRCFKYRGSQQQLISLQVWLSVTFSDRYWIAYCCNLSGGFALIVWFTTNGMCAKNKNIYAWREQAIVKEIAAHDLYCCLLPRCEALRTCRSGFPIATIPSYTHIIFWIRYVSFDRFYHFHLLELDKILFLYQRNPEL